MLLISDIKANPDEIIRKLKIKGFDGEESIRKILSLDAERRSLQAQNDNTAATLKKLASTIGALMKNGEKDKAEETKREVASLKEEAAGRVKRQEENYF
jgi:seryl-tRNA synthetase